MKPYLDYENRGFDSEPFQAYRYLVMYLNGELLLSRINENLWYGNIGRCAAPGERDRELASSSDVSSAVAAWRLFKK